MEEEQHGRWFKSVPCVGVVLTWFFLSREVTRHLRALGNINVCRRRLVEETALAFFIGHWHVQVEEAFKRQKNMHKPTFHQKSTFTTAEMNTRGITTPTTCIPFHTKYDYWADYWLTDSFSCICLHDTMLWSQNTFSTVHDLHTKTLWCLHHINISVCLSFLA